MSLLKSALRNPITIIVAIISIFSFSLASIFNIPVDIFPKLDLPTIYIAQQYGGMSPAQMEGFISTRYQDQFLYVSGIKNIEVKNIQGLSLIKLSFYEGTDMAQAAGEVASQVNRVMSYLPAGTVPPTVVRFDASSLPVGEIVFKSNTRSLNEIQDLASTKIRAMFSSIPGVSSPPPFGGNARTIVIKVDPERMRSYQLSPDEIVKAITLGNTIAPAGNIRMGDFMYLSPVNSVIEKVKDFLSIPIRKGSGTTVFIRDIASVEDGADVTTGYALVNGKRAVYIPVTKRAEASTWDVVNNVKKALPQMQSLLPDDVKISYEFDQSVYVINAVKSLISEGILGAILTGLMVLLFLGDKRSALIVVLTIPIAILTSVLCLYLSGQTINIMTLSGLALAIGILVDQATVTIENIHQHLEMGKLKSRAILDATREIALPAFLILLCVLAVFAPSFMMKGIPKSMFLPLSLSIGYAMIASFILSQTFVPVIANWMLKENLFHHHHSHHATLALNSFEVADVQKDVLFEEKHPKKLNRFEKIKLKFMETLGRLMKKRRQVLLFYFIGIFSIIIICAFIIGKDILPQANSSEFQLRIRAADGTRIERTELKLLKVLQIIDKDAGPNHVSISSAFVGMMPSSYGTSNIFIFNSGPHEAVMQVKLSEDFHPDIEDFKEKLRIDIAHEIPELKISFEPIELTCKIMSQGSPTPVEIMVAGKNLDDAKKVADQIKNKLSKIDYLRDVQISEPLRYPTITINIDRERAAQLGLNVSEISKSLTAATSSSRFTDKNLWMDPKNGYAYQVQVEVPEYLMNDLEAIKNIPLKPDHSRPIVADIADVKIDTTVGEYDRMGPRRLVTLTANIKGVDLGTVSTKINAILSSMGTPPKGIIIEQHGLVKLLAETLSSLQMGLIVAILVIFLLLAANYQSFGLSLVVLVSIPAVIAGSLVLLIITKSTLNLQSYMGIIMSTGVSVANAILIVTNAERLRLENDNAEQAAIIGAGVRLRPILMTSLAMIAGMIPMAAGIGEAGDQTAPLGRAVIGGLIASTFAALFILPLAFSSIRKNASIASVSLDPEDEKSKYFDNSQN